MQYKNVGDLGLPSEIVDQDGVLIIQGGKAKKMTMAEFGAYMAKVISASASGIPTPSADGAGKSPVINQDGDAYELQTLQKMVKNATAGNFASLTEDGALADSGKKTDDFILSTKMGQPGGVATLSTSGLVPSSQLPEMDYIPTSQKASKNGVASLDSNGKVPSSQINISSSVSSSSATQVANSAAVKAAYDKASQAGDADIGTGTVLTGSDSDYPGLISSSQVTWKKINGVIYIKIIVTCRLKSINTKATIPVSFSAIPLSYTDNCVVSSLEEFESDGSILTSSISLFSEIITNSEFGTCLLLRFYPDDISTISGKTVTIEASAIITRTKE